jgi:hypothetical protein
MFFENRINEMILLENIQNHGYYIAKDVISKEFIDDLRHFWLNHIIEINVSKKFVRGNLILGESNFLSFSNIKQWCMFRNFDFLWNKQTHFETTKICLNIHKYRNKIQNININSGLLLNEQNYGVYISTSLYPDKIGMLEKHSDSHNIDSNTILHFMIPLTFKGVDYDSGGLYIIDKHGIEIDVDILTCKGDLIFFDGSCNHGVNIIQSSNSIGRLAVFAIPCFFQKDANYLVLKRSIKIFLIELLSKLHLIKLSKKIFKSNKY